MIARKSKLRKYIKNALSKRIRGDRMKITILILIMAIWIIYREVKFRKILSEKRRPTFLKGRGEIEV